MNQLLKDKLNGYGVVLRFVTPFMVSFFGALITFGVNSISGKLTTIQLHFTNHLAHHQDLEIGYERRLTQIEATRFTEKDGAVLEEKIKAQYPPRWLLDRIEKLEKVK
jgi:hypothetical protein